MLRYGKSFRQGDFRLLSREVCESVNCMRTTRADGRPEDSYEEGELTNVQTHDSYDDKHSK
jgi:hypothetical protein